jgi:uncharacterized protein (DUF2147 family)
MQLAKTVFATITATLMTAALAVPVYAAGPSPVGTWQSTTGESRYKVTLCGDGTQLCARLTWLRQDARTPQNLQYLGKTVVNRAVPIAPNKWNGSVAYDGDMLKGSVIMVSANQLKLSGCKAVFCQSMNFVRV